MDRLNLSGRWSDRKCRSTLELNVKQFFFSPILYDLEWLRRIFESNTGKSLLARYLLHWGSHNHFCWHNRKQLNKKFNASQALRACSPCQANFDYKSELMLGSFWYNNAIRQTHQTHKLKMGILNSISHFVQLSKNNIFSWLLLAPISPSMINRHIIFHRKKTFSLVAKTYATTTLSFYLFLVGFSIIFFR